MHANKHLTKIKINTYPWPLMLKLKQPSRSQPRESAPHCKIHVLDS
jgi:hypothetical protein